MNTSNDTLDGTATTPFTGSGGDSRQATLFFVDDVISNLQYTNVDLAVPDGSHDKPGVFSYSISAVPEPSSFPFLSCALGLAGLLRRKFCVSDGEYSQPFSNIQYNRAASLRRSLLWQCLYGLPRGGFGGPVTAFENLIHPDDRERIIRLARVAAVASFIIPQ